MYTLKKEKDAKARYLKLEKLGSGGYSIVHKAIDQLETDPTKQYVALKKINAGMINEFGVQSGALREIKVLQEIKHEYVVEMRDVFSHKDNIYIVYECMDTDLEIIINRPDIIINEADAKAYLKMILESIAFCHKNFILHRDLKPSNILIDYPKFEYNEETKENVLVSPFKLKLSDFGLARSYGSPENKYSPTAITKWYRPPEMLYGSTQYGPSAEIWSVGCIFAQLLLRRALFPGDLEIDMLKMIFAITGTPTEQNWPQAPSLPNFISFNYCAPKPLGEIFKGFSKETLDLLSKMITLDPLKRITVEEALMHPCFTNSTINPTPKDALLPAKPNDEKNKSDMSISSRVSGGNSKMDMSLDMSMSFLQTPKSSSKRLFNVLSGKKHPRSPSMMWESPSDGSNPFGSKISLLPPRVSDEQDGIPSEGVEDMSLSMEGFKPDFKRRKVD